MPTAAEAWGGADPLADVSSSWQPRRTALEPFKPHNQQFQSHENMEQLGDLLKEQRIKHFVIYSKDKIAHKRLLSSWI